MARFGFLSTYPPTRCGLATFTAALASALSADDGDESVIVRVDDLVPAGPAVPGPRLRIAGELHPGDLAGSIRAAEILDDCDAVIVQHEYGIYGGRDGDEILDLLDRLTQPTIVVLHTVLAAPSPHLRDVTVQIAERSDAIVAMTQTAMRLLTDEYGIPSQKVHLIPHGVDPWVQVAAARRTTRPVILTWGLLGPGKGIEWGAMAMLKDFRPRPLYRILGQTHPKVARAEGERYRESLASLAKRVGVAASVEIDGRYRETAELAAEVAAADIVLLPYDSRDQATSGVLAEAVAAGKLVIATRFPHAIELLTRGAGVLVDQKRPDQMADAVRVLLDDPGRARAATERAQEIARANSWTAVADSYRELAGQLAHADAVGV